MTTAIAITDRGSALEYLLGRINYEQTAQMPYHARHFKLRRMEQLLGLLGDPHLSLPAIHIAGTKGKGSTAVMVDSILRAAGYRTGLYTSPHLERIEERFVLDGQACDEADFVDTARRVQAAVDILDWQSDLTRDGPFATYFEITTAMAMLLFAQRRVDLAVLEVGLGGRLDSTNVCSPLVSAVTSISYDHVQQLGTTLASIAREKAGIIKPGVPVVSGAAGEEAAEVIRAVAAEKGCRLQELDRDFGYEYRGTSPGNRADFHSDFNYWSANGGQRSCVGGLRLSLLGRHQAANAAVAVAMIEQLREQSYRISEESVRRGLLSAALGARIELVSREPAVVLDAAHNVASAEALVDVLRESFPDRSDRTLILATSRDKDAGGILQALVPYFRRVIFTRFQNNPRAADPEELRQLAAPLRECEVCESPAAALAAAVRRAGPDSLICIAGSFFLAAEMRPLLVVEHAS